MKAFTLIGVVYLLLSSSTGFADVVMSLSSLPEACPVETSYLYAPCRVTSDEDEGIYSKDCTYYSYTTVNEDGTYGAEEYQQYGSVFAVPRYNEYESLPAQHFEDTTYWICNHDADGGIAKWDPRGLKQVITTFLRDEPDFQKSEVKTWMYGPNYKPLSYSVMKIEKNLRANELSDFDEKYKGEDFVADYNVETRHKTLVTYTEDGGLISSSTIAKKGMIVLNTYRYNPDLNVKEILDAYVIRYEPVSCDDPRVTKNEDGEKLCYLTYEEEIDMVRKLLPIPEDIDTDTVNEYSSSAFSANI